MARYSLRELVPELDWAVLDPVDAERRALERLADGLDGRLLPLLAWLRACVCARVRARAQHHQKSHPVRARGRTAHPRPIEVGAHLTKIIANATRLEPSVNRVPILADG